MKTKTHIPLLALLIVVVMALAGIAGGYALWSKTMQISGVVDTGNVDVEWALMGCFDFESKDVGHTSAWIDPDDLHIAYFHVDNAYPGYIGDCEMEYVYTGSVPVWVEDINLTPGPELTGCEITKNPRTGEVRVECNELDIRWVDGLCSQLHMGDSVAASLRATLKQPAQYNAQYTFSVEIQLYQYNESTACPIP